ncbi:DnaJ domain, tetratricopeptide-like helical domain protein [Tanacetum coccineum]
MSPPLEDFTSSQSSSSSSTTYFQDPNPNNNHHQTDSGIFTTFNFINSNFNCSNDTASFADGRFSRRKYVKVKKHSSVSKPVADDGNSTGFVFNLNLGQSSRNGEKESNSGSDSSGFNLGGNGECLGFNKLRFTFRANDDIKLGSKVESSGCDFVFGVGETTDGRKVSENGGNKFVFGDNSVNVVNSHLSNGGRDESESSNTNDVDSHLVDYLSGLNLGTGGPLMNDRRKTVENDASDSGKSENVGFLFPTDLHYQKEESKVKVDNLNSTEVKSGDSVNDTLDSGVMFGNGEFNGGFHFGNQNDKRSTVKGRKKPADRKLKSKGAESSGNNSFSFGSNLGNSFGDTTQSKVSGETKTSVVNDPVKASTTNNINGTNGNSFSHSDNLFVFGSDKPNVSDGVPNGKPNPFLNTRFGFVSDVHNTEAHPTNGVGTTNNFTFPSNVGGFGTSFTGFNTPDINLSSSFTSDMFPGFGKKLEFGKTQRKVKKTTLKSKHQGGRMEVAHSFEEAAGCSPMDVSPYGVTECASTSTNEDAVDTKENPGATNVSSLSSSFADLNIPARQRPQMKKYKMKTGHDIEFKTSKSRLDPSCAHETHTSREYTKASDEEICDKWRKRGNQAYKNGDLSEAEACYSKGISSIQHTETSGVCIEPLLLCYSNRAAARMALGRMREGLKDCRMAAALDPSFLKVNLRSAKPESQLMSVMACSKAQKVTDCLKLSAELLQQKTYESATKALGIIAEALSISCYSEKLFNMKGGALFELGKHNEVVQLCEQTLDSAEKNIATGGVAGHTNADGYDCNSIKLWRWNLMSKSYFHLGKLEMALDSIDKHEQLRPAADKTVDSEYTLSSLAVTIRELLQCKNAGNVAFQSGNYTEAVEHYTAAISKSVKSHSFAAVCFCNRAAAHQSLGEIIDAIGDCSLAIALDRSYPKALSRRATLWEMIRDYKHATDDLQRLVSILETGENSQKSATPGRTANGSVKDLRKARRRLSSIEEKAKKERSLDLYLILGVKPSDAAVEVKKAYRKAALRHHPDKAGQVLARAESGSDGQQWKVITESIQTDADKIFKMIGEAYAVLSDSTKRSKYDLEEEMWDDAEVTFASTSRRSSDFYSSPYDFSNRRYTHESRKSYNSYSHYYPWEDSRKTYQSSYRW